jgi:branched-chain amino acid transport system ATP-binding protein
MLEVDGLNAFYGKSHVLHGVSFTVGAGEIVALLGRNGSGRSTTARAIMGLVRAEGTVRWKGASILGRPTHEIARRGLGQKGARPGRWTFEAMYDMFPVLGERRHASAGVLSGGEQQMLALCRTLMGDPGLMIVDEPTEGLAPAIVELVADCLRRLRDGGVPVLLIEQKLAIALRISDRALVMGHGGIVFDGTPGQLLADAATRREWLEV